MSWFMRRPRIKEPPKQLPHHNSPMTEKVMKEAKEKLRAEKPKQTK